LPAGRITGGALTDDGAVWLTLSSRPGWSSGVTSAVVFVEAREARTILELPGTHVAGVTPLAEGRYLLTTTRRSPKWHDESTLALEVVRLYGDSMKRVAAWNLEDFPVFATGWGSHFPYVQVSGDGRTWLTEWRAGRVLVRFDELLVRQREGGAP